jgi:hypothetical protein
MVLNALEIMDDKSNQVAEIIDDKANQLFEIMSENANMPSVPADNPFSE